MKVDQLSDFNEVIKYYKEILNLSKKLNPRTSHQDIPSIISHLTFNNYSELSYYRVMCNNISLFISQLHEKSLEIDDEQLLDLSFDKIESIKDIQGKNGKLTLLEKKKQFRNCLAHADYHLVFEGLEKVNFPNPTNYGVSVDSIYIYLENDYIKGRIPFHDIISFAEKYQESYIHLTHGTDISFLINSNVSKSKSIEHYIDETRKVKIYSKEDDSALSLDKFIYRFAKTFKMPKSEIADFRDKFEIFKQMRSLKSFDFEEVEIPLDRKVFMRKYIDYVGFNRFKHDPFATRALNEIIAPTIEDVVSLRILTGLTYTTHEIMQNRKTLSLVMQGIVVNDKTSLINSMKESVDNFLRYRFEEPMIYSNNLLGLAYYCFDYSREVNQNNGKSFFNFYDIEGLDGLQPKIIYKDGTESLIPIVEEVNPKTKAFNTVANIDAQIEKLKKEKQLKENTKTSLLNPKNKNPRKEEILASIDEWMEGYEESLEKLKNEKTLAEEVLENSEDVVLKDSSNFFRHLRNSMAHGNYTINYGSFGNMDEILYSFKDYDKETSSTYCVELTSKQLENLVDAFQKKLNESNKYYLNGKKFEKQLLEEALRIQGINSHDIDAQNRFEKAASQKDNESKENSHDTDL